VTVFCWLTVKLRQSGQVTWALLTGLWITPNRLTQGAQGFEITPNCLAQGTRGFLAYPELSKLNWAAHTRRCLSQIVTET